jgi:hypothetical protein
VADDVILPVPKLVSASYVVPSGLTADEATAEILSGLSAHVAAPAGTLVQKMLDAGMVSIASRPASSLPSLPASFQEYLKVPSDQVAAIVGASHYVVISARWPSGGPPVHEAAVGAAAGTLAAVLGVPVVDTFIPKVMAADAVLSRLPDAEVNTKLADWLLVFMSSARNGLWMSTKGLGRFGLPELQIFNIPPQLGRPWTLIMNGIASRLQTLWPAAVKQSGTSGFASIPALITVSEADVAAAHGKKPRGGGSISVRLEFDPATDEESVSFLTVYPPDDYAGSAGEFAATACESVLGTQPQDVRYLHSSDAMEEAMRTARASISSIRARFLAGELPLGAQLMVKHRVQAPGGSEYPWAYVTSWQDPARVLANSASDAVRDERIRAGRPIVIDAESIVDWAVWMDGKGIIEGGETNTVALQQGRD